MSNHTDTNLSSSVDHEHEQWSQLFSNELSKTNKELYSSYWWRRYYEETKSAILPLIDTLPHVAILEAGSGSGKGSIILGQNLDRTLLDISADALKYAKLLAKKFHATNIKFVEGDIFSMPFSPQSFDFVWNIGVLEHYEEQDAERLIKSMVKVTKKNGYVAIGVPNFRSPPIIKAKLLQYPILRLLPGYKLDSELNYSASQVEALVRSAAKSLKRSLGEVRVHHIGTPLFVESPRWAVATIGALAERLMPDRKFLTLVICELQ